MTVDVRDELRRMLAADMARKHLADFATHMDANYVVARHHAFLCSVLERMERDELKHVIILVPPRHGKTRLVSQILPAWWLGRHPRDEVILASNTEDLASDNSAKARDLIASDSYPFDVKVSTESFAKTLWRTTAGGVVRAVGIGSSVQGRGGNLLIVDDPVPGVEDATELAFERQWRWFAQDFFPRRLTQSHVILSMFRWGNGDLADRILSHDDADFKNDWTVVSLPAYAGEDDPLGRELGDVLWPVSVLPDGRKVGYDRAFLETQRKMDSRAWSAQYMLDPQPAEGRLFESAFFERRYDKVPHGLRVMSIDGAWKVGIQHSRSAVATWVTDGESYYIADAWAGRTEFPGLVEIVKAKILEQRPLVVLVEDAASGTPLVQELRRWNIGVTIEAIPPTAAKQTRAEATTVLFKNQKVALPEEAPWLKDWVTEHLRFPGKPNDQVDTTSLALTYLHAKVLEEQARRQHERAHEEWLKRNRERLRGWIAR